MSKKRKKPRPKTIGELTQSRLQWQINPVTRKTKDKTKYDRKNKPREEDY